MDHSSNSAEEAADSVNLGDQGLPFEFVRSEGHGLVNPNEALLKICQDMARVMEKLTAPKAPIDMIR